MDVVCGLTRRGGGDSSSSSSSSSSPSSSVSLASGSASLRAASRRASCLVATFVVCCDSPASLVASHLLAGTSQRYASSTSSTHRRSTWAADILWRRRRRRRRRRTRCMPSAVAAQGLKRRGLPGAVLARLRRGRADLGGVGTAVWGSSCAVVDGPRTTMEALRRLVPRAGELLVLGVAKSRDARGRVAGERRGGGRDGTAFVARRGATAGSKRGNGLTGPLARCCGSSEGLLVSDGCSGRVRRCYTA